MANIIAEGGFNTGRLYTANGQLVYWWLLDDGTVIFKDRSRMVHGFIDPPTNRPQRASEDITAEWIMSRYDRGSFETYRADLRDLFNKLEVPADFYHGPSLRI